MAKRMSIMVAILALVFGGIFWFLGYFKPKMVNAYFSSFQPPPAAVSATEAITSQRRPFLSSTGSVIAVEEVTITSEVAGIIKNIHFKSGTEARKSTVLVELDKSIDEAELKGMKASARLAQANYDRDKQLLARKAVSSINFETSLAELRNAQAQVESQEARIEKKSIRAPFAGTLGIRQVDQGEYLKAGTPIVTLQALDQVYVNFSLPEQFVSQVETGQKVEIEVAAWPEVIFSGQVHAIDARISQSTRNLQVQAIFDNPERKLRPGMFAEISLITGEAKNIVTVPESAIDAKLYGTSVFIINETKDDKDQPQLTVERRYVETGLTENRQVEVISGLKPGDKVVTAGQLKLQNGSRIVIDNSVQLN